MTYDALLDRIIADGVAACERDYAADTEKREGAVAGFEVCRGKAPAELARILKNARDRTFAARLSDKRAGYWRIRCFESEVEWVCNVVSAALQNQGLPTIVVPTARGYSAAAGILGVEGKLESG